MKMEKEINMIQQEHFAGNFAGIRIRDASGSIWNWYQFRRSLHLAKGDPLLAPTAWLGPVKRPLFAIALNFGPRPAGTRGAAGTSGRAADRTPALRRGASRLGPKWLRLKMM